MRTVRVLLLFCIVALGFELRSTVYACSGGGTDTIQTLLSRTDYVVKADVISVDDVRQNAILAVESYLYGGSGAKYLTFVQTDSANVTRIAEGGPYVNCYYFQPSLNPGMTGYFFLQHRADGVYVSTTGWAEPNYYVFADPDTTVRFYSGKNAETKYELRENEFAEFIATFGGTSPTTPQVNAPFPRPAPLRITTDAEIDYVLPVDSGTPIKVTEAFIEEMTLSVMGYDSTQWNEQYFRHSDCPDDGCIQISPDGVNRAEQRDSRVLWLGGSAVGNAFSFSSTSDAIAVWNEDRIEFYTLGWAKHDQPFQEVTLLNQVTLNGDINVLPLQAAWSPDGRLFTYSDALGLWTIDVYGTAALPSSLLKTENSIIPIALAYSPLGRYLQVQQGAKRLTLDTLTGERFPDGIVSPTDQVLLAFDTTLEEFEPQICYLAPVHACDGIIPSVLDVDSDNPRVFIRYRQAEWSNHFNLIFVVCEQEQPTDCVVKRITNSQGLWSSSTLTINEGYAFDYLPTGDLLAIVQSVSTIAINGDVIELSAALEGDITQIEWLPTLFYRL